ncbi:hypothetical protein JL722_15126 [Aureococcus anophagefferens]|nr:hypothetical protein JL722_15126 [Aureococcus anophagefferens]
MASKKCVKPEGQEPDEIESQVAAELYNLEQSSTELKAELKELYFLSAKEVEVGGGKKAIIVFVPFGLLKSYHKIQTRLVLKVLLDPKDQVNVETKLDGISAYKEAEQRSLRPVHRP